MSRWVIDVRAAQRALHESGREDFYMVARSADEPTTLPEIEWLLHEGYPLRRAVDRACALAMDGRADEIEIRLRGEPVCIVEAGA